ncbi:MULTISPECIES: hypothetical protein [unclassified Burkholderia]|uniref:hypothetical protein n=1 Tax=unclassified Burkholderia TaxID=2613784 RepID=UPI000F5938B1|nr:MULTISPECIES: hypothetical protein [unclassified Burkholderia]RQS48006.1 hypothetical protein DID99_28885 [Burkholderia sp. Bp8986]RQS53101.1 hypothetical protein DID98_30130 [Burkholderia sp. Bp8984]
MTSRILRYTVRSMLWLVATTTVLVLLLFVILMFARYEIDEGSCPDAPAAELEAKILAFAKEQGISLTDVSFTGTPRYHDGTLGWWGFDLSAREGDYVTTIDCSGRVSGFGTIQRLPDPPGPSR